MENSKFFLHRIQEENGSFTKGIEIHDNLNSAIRSFWGRMKNAYTPAMTFTHCKITDVNGNAVEPYDMTSLNEEVFTNKFFMHSIREDGKNISKSIDAYDSYDDARAAFATAMEYGYDNTRFPNVDYVSCEITDKSGIVLKPYAETWIKAVEPVAEVEE